MGKSENQQKRAGQYLNNKFSQFKKNPAEVLVRVVQEPGQQTSTNSERNGPRRRSRSRRRSSSRDRHRSSHGRSRSRSRRPSRKRSRSRSRRPVPGLVPKPPAGAHDDYLLDHYRKELDKAQQHVEVLTKTNHQLEEMLKQAEMTNGNLVKQLEHKFAIDNKSLEKVMWDVLTPQIKEGLETVLASDGVVTALKKLQDQVKGG